MTNGSDLVDGTDEGGKTAEIVVTSAQWDELKTQVAKSTETWERFVRLNADFDNYKKRATREKSEAIKYANESLIERLIPVLDNFDMAMLSANGPQGASVDSLKTGVTMISTQMRSALNDAGLEEINAEGQVFDPNLHEAVSHQPSADVPEGNVLQQLRKGYKLRDRLVRPATVVVAKKAD